MYPTPHINAAPEDFGKTVLMPGDPLRSAFIAKNFLSGAKLINNVRGVQGYTGTYKGVKVTVMASGMGMPSIGIYSHELFNFFGVQNIIRVGSAGSLRKDVKVRDIVIGMGACTDSAYPQKFGLAGTFAPIADYFLLSSAVETAKKCGMNYFVGNLLSSDIFYCDDVKAQLKWAQMGVCAVEMETAALYCEAAASSHRALAVCTISDSVVTGESLDANDRQTGFSKMIELALEVAVKAENEPI